MTTGDRGRSVWNRIAMLWRRRTLARDIDDELAFHVAMRAQEPARAGDPDAAARLARRQFGNVAVYREEVQDMWRFPSLESVWQDLKYAFRTLRRAPAFTVVAVLVLGIGIGANAAIFSLVDAMVVRGLPYPHADRLMVLIGNVQRATVERRGNSYPDFADWRDQSKSFDAMAAYSAVTLTFLGGAEPERVTGESVSAPYFDLIGATPAIGRVFRPEEDAVPNRDFVMILSDSLWKRRFGGTPAVVNAPVSILGRTFTVIGVMPPGVTGVTDAAEFWVPFVSVNGTTARGNRGFFAIARLKGGVSVPQAQSEMTAISRQLEIQHPQSNEKRGVEVSSLKDLLIGQLNSAVLALMAAVVLVLLVACANVANLLIGKSESRQREIAVRTALGAGQRRLLRQLVTESCVLSLFGALAGVAVAEVGLRTLVATSPVTFPSYVQPTLNLTALMFMTAMALLCGLVLGLAPAMHARLNSLGAALKDSARGTSSARAHRLRGVLVVAEVALAIVLVVGAGLMIQSVRNLTALDPGFDPTSVLSLQVNIPRAAAPAPAPTPVPGQPPPPPPPLLVSPAALLERVRALPGVESVALSSDIPLGAGGSAIFYQAEGDTTSGAQTVPRAYRHYVTPEYFATLRLPLRAGRVFTDADVTPASTAVIVSENVVKRFWPEQNPIGKRISSDQGRTWFDIVGVVGEAKHRGLPANPTQDPDVFLPFTDRTGLAMLVRASRDAEAIASSVRQAVAQAAPGVVVYNISTIESLVAQQTAPSRFTSWLMGLLAATALVLAVVGIYGVMSYLVSQRQREFGIRMALGASRAGILKVVVGQGAKLVAIGVAIGIPAAIGLARLLSFLLFGVSPLDASAAIAVSLLTVVALAACAVPAIRATQVDPVVALRTE